MRTTLRPAAPSSAANWAGFLARNADALGLTGVADQLLPTLDTLLERQMRSQLDRGDSDPYTGGFHPAWYFLTARGETTRFSDSWVSALPTAAALAERGPDGHPRIPTGISHGLAGYAVFLDRWLLSLALHPRAAALRQRLKKIGRDYLKVFEDRCDDAFTHGCFYRDGRSETTSRLSLAYGDAGILAAGWQLALTLREGAVAERFLARLRRTAGRRTQRETGITGGSLLYGSAGVLLFFGHLQQRAPCPEFAEATRYWKARARAQVPSFRREDLPVSGPYDYPAMKRLSLFEGAIGPPLAEWALRTDITDLSNLFYLP